MSSLVVLDESNQAYQNFINTIKSDSTRYVYTYCLKKYMQHKQYSEISQLFSKIDAKWIESDIIEYIVYLRKVKKLSSSATLLYSGAIIQFYVINDIQLNVKKIYRYLGEYKKEVKDRAYTTEEVHKLLEFCDERTRCLVLLLASTGMRIGALPTLRIGNLENMGGDKIYKITVYENSKEEYYTFCTPECASAIDNYLEYRKRYGEKITENSPLFREQFDINDIDQAKKARFIKLSALERLLDITLNRAGLREKYRQTENDGDMRGRIRKGVARAHGFRKFAKS